MAEEGDASARGVDQCTNVVAARLPVMALAASLNAGARSLVPSMTTRSGTMSGSPDRRMISSPKGYHLPPTCIS